MTTTTALGTARLLAGTRSGQPVDLAAHRSLHGPVRPRDRAGLLADVEAVRLLGRGGAAFPVAAKLRSLPDRGDIAVVLNGSESEPASRKDRALMTLAPHLVLDGAAVVAAALGARQVTVAVHDPAAATVLRAAYDERRHHEPGPAVEARRQSGDFVAGEVRALLRGLDGGPAVPPGRRTLPTVRGLGGRPTFAGNVETFAQIALLISLGPRRYAEVGHRDEPGTTLLTLLGDTTTRGVVEVPTGLPLDALLPGPGGPVLIGGYHGRWVRDAGDLVVARPALRAQGLSLGAGVLARLPRDVCALAEVADVTGWLAEQSAGQCGPCLFGTDAVARDVAGLLVGRSDPQATARLADLPGRGACSHPDGTAGFVASALDVMADEVAAHARAGGCGRRRARLLPVGTPLGTPLDTEVAS